MTRESPPAPHRARTVVLALGVSLAAVVILGIVFSPELLTAYYLRKLRRDDAFLLEAVVAEADSLRFAAVRKFVRGDAGKRAVYQHLLGEVERVLNAQLGSARTGGGRVRYVVRLTDAGGWNTQQTRATVGVEWFAPRVVRGRILVRRDDRGLRHVGVSVRVEGEWGDRAEVAQLDEASPLAALCGLLGDEAFADASSLELPGCDGFVFSTPPDTHDLPNISSLSLTVDPRSTRVLTWLRENEARSSDGN